MDFEEKIEGLWLCIQATKVGGGGVQKLTPPNPRASDKTQNTFLNQNLTPKLSKAEFPSHKWISRTQRQSQNKFGFTSFAELLAP